MKASQRDPVVILRVGIDPVTMAEAVQAIGRLFGGEKLSQVATVNPEFVMRAQDDPEFLSILQHAQLCVADGIGLVWAARLLGTPLPERVPGSELVYKLAAWCADHGKALFLLGAAPGVAEEAGRLLQKKFPSLKIAGSWAGSPNEEESDEIVARINDSQADMLYVAYGAPAQDKWIQRYGGRLTTVRVALGVGGALDFVTGRAIRAPQWVQALGLEWLHRLIKEPWRWRRMLALPRFAWQIFKVVLNS